MTQGETDQTGRYTGATFDQVDPSPESIAKLWRARAKFQEVDASANGSAQVSLVPVSLQ